MILTFAFALLSVAASVSAILFSPLHENPWYWFLLIVFIPVGYALAFLVYIIYLFIVSLFIDSKKDRMKINRFALWHVPQVCTQLLLFGRAKLHVSGKEKIPQDGKKFLIVSNHLSNFDQIAINFVFRHYPFLCITKPGNIAIPVAGPWMEWAGYIPINREDAFEGVKSILKAIGYIKRNDCSICIAPEGTRSKDHLLHEFHPGSFKIATKAECPVVVVALRDTYKIAKRFPWRSTDIFLDIIDVIEPSEFQDGNTVELSLRCHDEIEKKISENQG